MEASTVTSAEAVPRARARTARKPKKDRTPWYMWLAVAAIAVFCLFPFYWLINMSLKAGSDLSGSAIFPHHPTLSNYSAIFKNPDFVASLRNSAIVASITTALVCSSPRAHSRLTDFAGRNTGWKPATGWRAGRSWRVM